VPVCLQGMDDLLTEVRAGNQSALESIRTLSCRVALSSPASQHPIIAPITSDYWWSPGSSRLRSNVSGQLTESVVHDFIARSISRSRDPNGREHVRFSIVRAVPNSPDGRADPWGHGLLKLCGPGGFPLTLNELLEQPHRLRYVKRVKEKERELILMGLAVGLSPEVTGEFEIWFDPELNYLARRLTGEFSGLPSDSDQADRRESEVLAFTEVSRAVYFPVHAETKFYAKDRLVHHDVVKFSNVKVNEPFPSDFFELPIPPGALVYDEIQGKEYQLDSQGKQVGPERPIAQFAPLPAGRSSATTEEPKPWTRWILPGSAVLLAFAGVGWFISKMRQGGTRT
jgi:hypothetical protein